MLSLVPFTEALLPAVRPWFEHPEVRRRLGGPEWPERGLTHTESDDRFRGRRVLRTHSWVALDGAGAAVAHIGGDVYDRWCRYTESPAGSTVDRVEPGPSMGLAYVVDPRRWRRGLGRATLLAVVAAPEVADVRLFALGIDADNLASTRCALSAGFTADDTEPDWEDIVYYVRRR